MRVLQKRADQQLEQVSCLLYFRGQCLRAGVTNVICPNLENDLCHQV